MNSINEDMVDAYIKHSAKKGWKLIGRNEFGIQLTKSKQLSMIGIVLGTILLPFWGIGLIFWVLVLVDYLAFQSEKTSFVSYSKMRKQLRGRS